MSRVTRTVKREALDRATWSSPVAITYRYQTEGSGTFITDEFLFATPFEGVPFFSYGVESTHGAAELVVGDYPFVTVGVAEWVIQESTEEDFEEKRIKPFHLGAKLWISVSSSKAYALSYSMVFEGVIMKNPELFGGQNG
jgi:hypothetical protein